VRLVHAKTSLDRCDSSDRADLRKRNDPLVSAGEPRVAASCRCDAVARGGSIRDRGRPRPRLRACPREGRHEETSIRVPDNGAIRSTASAWRFATRSDRSPQLREAAESPSFGGLFLYCPAPDHGATRRRSNDDLLRPAQRSYVAQVVRFGRRRDSPARTREDSHYRHAEGFSRRHPRLLQPHS
jgi:hypothetical protein